MYIYDMTADKFFINCITTSSRDIKLNSHGKISHYKAAELKQVPPPPRVLEHLSSLSSFEEFQPFRKVAGCIDEGFKVWSQWFIDSLRLTKSTEPECERIKEWCDAIDMIEDILLNTPDKGVQFKMDDVEAFNASLSGEKAWNDPYDPVRQQTVLDVTWHETPVEVNNEVRDLWGDRELGNDNYIAKVTVDEELFEDYPYICMYLLSKGIDKGTDVWVHFWW